MTAAIYTRLGKTVPRMLAKYGQPVTISSTDVIGSIVTRSAQALENGIVDHVLGDSGVQIGDKKLLIDAGGNPAPGDRVHMDGASFVIVDPVKPIKPAALVLGFECYARAG